MTISFYCTRCRALLSHSEELSGEVIHCSKCEQAIIVPTFSFGRETGGNLPEGVPVVHHLDPERSVHPFSSVEYNETAPADDSLVYGNPLDDDEFMARLRPAPRSKLPNDHPIHNASLPESFEKKPPTIEDDFFNDFNKFNDLGQEKAGRSRWLLIAGIAIALLVGGLTATFVSKNLLNPEEKEPENRPIAHSIAIDGKVTYVGPTGTSPDEGAIIFLFPLHWDESPLVIGRLSPALPTPVDFPTKNQPETKGVYFARADSEGLFDFRITQAGTFRVLIVSAHRLRTESDSSSQKREDDIAQISQCLYSPTQTLLRDHDFYLCEETLSETNYRIDYRFGR